MSEIDNAGNPFTPPAALVQDAAPVIGDLAGRGARFAAAMIDGIVAFVLTIIVMVSSSVSMFEAGNKEPDLGKLFGAYGIVFLVYFVLQGLLLWRRSQTIGKIALSIRIVRTDRSRAGFARLLWLRMIPMWLVSLIPLIGPLISLVDSLMIFRESRRCLHDDIADTVVIRV